MRLVYPLFLMALLVLFPSCSDHSWGDFWNVSEGSPWKKRRKINFNNVGNGQLTDIPVPVFLSSARIDYTNCQTLGQDIRFYDADGVTALPYEIELWSPGGTSILWVKVPQIASNSAANFIYMSYANPKAAAGATPTGVWSPDYKGVYHMANGQDSTANANHATTVSNVTFSNSSVFGGRGFFDAVTVPYLTIPITGLTTTSATIEAVVELRTAPGSAATRYIFSHTSGTNDRIYLSAYNTTSSFMGTVGNVLQQVSASAYSLNTLTYVTLVYAGPPPGNFYMYYNGVQTDTNAFTSHTILSSAKIGNYGFSPQTAADAWDGYIHEVRISNSAKSASYILAQNRATTDTFLIFGPEENN